MRSGHALLGVNNLLVVELRAQLVQHLDVPAVFHTLAGVCHVVVAPDFDVPCLSKLHPSPVSEQLVIVTWSGHVWARHSERRHPLTMHASLVDVLCTEVFRVMSMQMPFLAPCVCEMYMVRARRLGPFSMELGCPTSAKLTAGQLAS